MRAKNMSDAVNQILVQVFSLSIADQVQVMCGLRDSLAQAARLALPNGVGEDQFSSGPLPTRSAAEETPAGTASATARPAAVVPVAVRNVEEITYQIIGCAMRVHRVHGPGLRENSYQRDLEAQFCQTGLLYTAQKLLEVHDSVQGGSLIGYYIPDFVVADRVVVEIKALDSIDNSHVAQVIGYLAVTGCPVGLIINFGRRSLQWQRVLPPKDITLHRANRQWLFVPDWLNATRTHGA
jgi:GxxExxY protein